ncbi:hypothetical protein ABS755_08100 [Castellaniella sp. FW104-16D08]|uniref:hypothetical protein n=1 Tax=unclassified Castellaniella TaxID=2617606 RepID=UPI00331452DB
MKDAYSPHTGEFIDTDNPAGWMGRAGVECPVHDPAAQSVFWRGGPAWMVEDVVHVEPVPESVSRAQGKAALIQAGLWDGVQAYVAGIADPTQKALAQVALDDTTEWRRDSPFLVTAAAVLGITSAQLDALFVAAAKIIL